MAEYWNTPQQQYVRLNYPQNSHISLLPMKGNGASITFHQKTWRQTRLVFILLALQVAIAKLMHYITYAITLECFHIVMHHFL